MTTRRPNDDCAKQGGAEQGIAEHGSANAHDSTEQGGGTAGLAAVLAAHSGGASRTLGVGVYEVVGPDGPVIAKRGRGPGAVAAEAASLRWLAAARAVPVPVVLGADDDWLAIARIEPGEPSGLAAEELGRGLAALHRAGAAAFGVAPPGGPVDAWIGAAGMANVPGVSWPEWYAEHRIRPYLRAAADAGRLDRGGIAAIEAVCARLPELAGPPEPPARLHGDLWRGNVLWGADGRAWLIDPAAHGGHRETDLAMLALFGCPHLDRTLAAYDEAAPLGDGWRARVALHQLFPLLVHTVLFGRDYADRATAAADTALTTG